MPGGHRPDRVEVSQAGPLVVVSGPAGVGKSTVCGLLAEHFDRSVCIGADDFAAFIRRGFIEQWRVESHRQNETLGAAMAVAAMAFAEGGYAVVLDGHFFPHGFDGLAEACAARGIEAHYAVLRADLQVCRARATARDAMDPGQQFDELHGRLQALGVYEPHVIDATGPATQVAATLLQRLVRGELAARAR